MFIGSGVQIGGGIRVISEFTGIVTSGLQVNLQSAPSSGTTWTDVQGGYNATLQGSPSYVSNNGGGIRLNNSSFSGTDYISLPYNISSSTATVEIVASFNPTSYWATIWGNEIYNSATGYIAYMTSATGITWGDGNGSTTATITASNSIRHWVFVINGTEYLLYLNGAQLGTTYVQSPALTVFATSDFYFGARHQNAGGGPGTDKMNNSTAANYPVFYQMRIYNKALSAAEVTQNYTAIRGTYGI